MITERLLTLASGLGPALEITFGNRPSSWQWLAWRDAASTQEPGIGALWALAGGVGQISYSLFVAGWAWRSLAPSASGGYSAADDGLLRDRCRESAISRHNVHPFVDARRKLDGSCCGASAGSVGRSVALRRWDGVAHCVCCAGAGSLRRLRESAHAMKGRELEILRRLECNAKANGRIALNAFAGNDGTGNFRHCSSGVVVACATHRTT